MINELHTTLEAGAGAEFDLIIVGAGPAGISLAMELNGTDLKVALLEAGGLDDPGAGALDLLDGENLGLPYAIASSRQRFFGGTSNHWGGWCRPLDPNDLAERDWVPMSGWPLSAEELGAWYRPAHRLLEMENLTYDAEGQVSAAELLPADPDSGFVNRLFRFSPPTRFGSLYRQELAASRNVSVFLHAPVIELRHEAGHIEGCRVRGANGADYPFQARVVVLAMGGLEVPRLLLHTGIASAPALGDQSGLLGRCFMEHYGYSPGFLMVRSALRYDRHAGPEADQLPVLAPRPDFLQRERILNCCVSLTPVEPDEVWPPEAMATPGLAAALSDGAWRYRVTMINESSPYPDSRVTLAEARDALGLHRIRLDWRINPQDFAGVQSVVQALATWLGRRGLGRVQFSRPISSDTTTSFGTGMHHMGTTRMSVRPEDGVVDPDCRVHGTDNLFVASSSVFPTSGYANPTLTIVALSLRLAAHLKERLQ